jgi:hypothetical protein
VKIFTCRCGWAYVITSKQVYGPLWDEGWSLRVGTMMALKQWKHEYADCAGELRRAMNDLPE